MATQSPFSFLDGLFGQLGNRLQPPAWMVDEVQHRVVLFLNHVLQQEPEAQERLARQQGKVVMVQWREMYMRLAATPAGLLDRAIDTAIPDLTLTITDTSPATLAKAAFRGEKPAIRIEGDVQLAAEVNWLVDNVRWDIEDDLARVIGDGPAHTASDLGRKAAEALRRFVAQRPGAKPDETTDAAGMPGREKSGE
jgi:ubiquinone biosynthesis protein UbiJ